MGHPGERRKKSMSYGDMEGETQAMSTATFSIHQVIGWQHCANLRCRRPLQVDHVTLTTTTHIRRFCQVECVIDGFAAWHELIFSPAWLSASNTDELQMAVLNFIAGDPT